MKYLKDRLFISVEKEFEDSIKVGGLELFLYTGYQKGLHQRIYGFVEMAQ